MATSSIRYPFVAGQRLGFLEVISEHRRSRVCLASRQKTQRVWLCKCDCGSMCEVIPGEASRGLTVSCGCYGRNRLGNANRTHQQGKTPTWNSWRAMKSRCSSPTNSKFHHYSGRGITVCSRWHHFEAFLEDMGERPSKLHTLDRRDPDGNYEPGNCRWATWKEQRHNRRPEQKLLKTHCKNGHEFTSENTRWCPGRNGILWRACVTCKRLAAKACYHSRSPISASLQ